MLSSLFFCVFPKYTCKFLSFCLLHINDLTIGTRQTLIDLGQPSAIQAFHFLPSFEQMTLRRANSLLGWCLRTALFIKRITRMNPRIQLLIFGARKFYSQYHSSREFLCWFCYWQITSTAVIPLSKRGFFRSLSMNFRLQISIKQRKFRIEKYTTNIDSFYLQTIKNSV